MQDNTTRKDLNNKGLKNKGLNNKGLKNKGLKNKGPKDKSLESESLESESLESESLESESPKSENESATCKGQKSTEALLKHPKLWRAGELAQQQLQSRHGIPTGFSELDDLLPDHGWPGAALMELLMPSAGLGELRLLMPAIKHLSQTQSRWVAWINPPFIPYAPALQKLGVDTHKILLIHPRSHEDTLWALERASRSGSCSLAMAWLDEQKLQLKDTQRLQVATRQGETLTCLFRPDIQTLKPSMAELRLQLRELVSGQLQLDLLKRRGGWPVQGLTLPIADTTHTRHRAPAEIREQLELWRHTHRQPQAHRYPELKRPIAPATEMAHHAETETTAIDLHTYPRPEAAEQPTTASLH